MEVEFTDEDMFTLHTVDGERKPKLIRPTMFPYPMLDFLTMETRMMKIRLSRTGSLPNHPDAIREYLMNNRTSYLFIGDTEYQGSIITLRCFDNKVMINREPDEKYKSLIVWAMDNAYYKYINAIDAYDRSVKSGEIEPKTTSDEVSGHAIPNLDDGLLDELYAKLEDEAEKDARKQSKPQQSLY